jgi:hypothetical protein
MLMREVSVRADMLKEVDAIVSLPIFDAINSRELSRDFKVRYCYIKFSRIMSY